MPNKRLRHHSSSRFALKGKAYDRVQVCSPKSEVDLCRLRSSRSRCPKTVTYDRLGRSGPLNKGCMAVDRNSRRLAAVAGVIGAVVLQVVLHPRTPAGGALEASLRTIAESPIWVDRSEEESHQVRSRAKEERIV